VAGADGTILRHELSVLQAELLQLGATIYGPDTYVRLQHSLTKLATLSSEAIATRTLLAYKVLFRTFAYCNYCTVRVVLGRTNLLLNKLDVAAPRDANVNMQLRADIIHAALTISTLTRLIPGDLVACINPFFTFFVAIAMSTFSEVVNGPALEYWPGIDPEGAVCQLEGLIAFLNRLSLIFQVVNERRQTLYDLCLQGHERLLSLKGIASLLSLNTSNSHSSNNIMTWSNTPPMSATPSNEMALFSLADNQHGKTLLMTSYSTLGTAVEQTSIATNATHLNDNLPTPSSATWSGQV
jgi:hypothetical protein